MKYNLLSKINNPNDLKSLNSEQLKQVAKELRDFIINAVAVKEGHLGSNLGVIELTLALHYVFNTPHDLLIWDVGHQAYAHKIITGRRDVFYTNRQFKGISGFPSRNESEYDSFGVGHSSTSISAALGMAIASNLNKNTKRQHIAIIGDASIASGMAFEALNHAGATNANILVVLNDNAMGIDPAVGALNKYFKNIKNKKKAPKNNLITALNFEYSGPIDGYNLETLITEFKRLQKIKGPKFLHVITTKGKGLAKAEANQVKYHAPGKFDVQTGEIILKENINLAPKYQDVFGATLLDLAKKNKKIIGITPAMPSGSSLKLMMDVFPERAFDVGIAEQHAVTLAAGMATQGFFVFCAIYSTFLQRAFDQIIHDVALQNLPVIFCVDRAGLVGEDGATHHGVFDTAFLRCIPNMIIYAPRNEIALQNIIYTAQLGLKNPLAIRYPRGQGVTPNWNISYKKIPLGKAFCIKKGTKIAILSHGTIGNNVTKALENISNSNIFAHYDFPFVKPLDEKKLHYIFTNFKTIITIEDGVIKGGFGSAVNEFLTLHNYKSKIILLGIPDFFISHGSVSELQKQCGIDAKSLEIFFSEF